jgi:hypothetical protein
MRNIINVFIVKSAISVYEVYVYVCIYCNFYSDQNILVMGGISGLTLYR